MRVGPYFRASRVTRRRGIAPQQFVNHPDTACDASAPRICWLTEEFYPPQIGGAELMVARLTQGLAHRGFAVNVITRQPERPCAPRERIGRVVVRRIRPAGQIKGSGWPALPFVFAYLARLAWLLVREARGYDILIVSGMKVIPLVAVPVSRLLGKRCVVRLESTSEISEPLTAESVESMANRLGRLARAFSSRVQWSMLRRADRAIAPSAALQAALRTSGFPTAQVSTIPNAVDLAQFHPVTPRERLHLRGELGLPRDATLLIFIARLSRAKGIDLLVDAWPRIAARHPELCLVIVGAGAGSYDDCERDIAESIRRAALGPDRVRMTGVTDRVADYLQAADLYILPSDYEGFGVGIIEALATGLPTLLTPVGVAPQLVRDGENGFLFPVRDREAMIRAIDTAMTVRARWPEIGARARAAVEGMGLETVVQEYVQLCADLVGGRSNSTGRPSGQEVGSRANA